MLIFRYKIKTKTKKMENSTHTDFDVLGDLEALNSSISIGAQQEAEKTISIGEEVAFPAHTEEKPEEISEKKKWTLHYIGFMIKYCFTCGFIFMLLLVSTNFNAYFNIAKGYVFSWELEKNERWLINSVEAGSIVNNNEQIEKVILESRDEKYEKKVKELEKKDEKIFHSINKIATKAKSQDINLDIEIAPYENRVIIPKIGKNIPLLDVKDQEVNGLVELNDIFMEELEDGIVRYPWSAKPGETGNAFIFGHSSNFPWLEGDYKDVFALLHKVTYDDEVVVYYGQRKYTYKITTKQVVRPGDVSVLKRDKWISEITLMTCWPVGTTLNRMILIWELVEE